MTSSIARLRTSLAEEAPLSAVLKSVGARAVTLPISAVASILTIRIVIDELGARGYALYALIAAVPLLLPVADLGLGAAVTDVVARRHFLGEPVVRAVVGAVFTRLLVVAGALTAAAAALGATGRWHWLLGVSAGADVERAATFAIVAFAASVPLSMGLRVLLGGGLNHHVVLLQAGTTVLVLCLVAIAGIADGPMWVYPAVPGAALAMTGAMSIVVAGRRSLLSRDALALRWRVGSGHGVWHMALPMLVLSVSLPVTYHTGRLILSHVSTLAEVAAYSVLFQLYAPLMSVVSAAGLSLWPAFASTRDTHAATWPQLRRLTTLFSVGGLLLALPLAVLGSRASELLSGGAIVAPAGLAVAFGALLWAQAVVYPSGMLLTDPQGLRFQAVASVLAAAAAVALSLALAGPWGATGPAVATLVGFVACLLVPLMVRARERSRR